MVDFNNFTKILQEAGVDISGINEDNTAIANANSFCGKYDIEDNIIFNNIAAHFYVIQKEIKSIKSEKLGNSSVEYNESDGNVVKGNEVKAFLQKTNFGVTAMLLDKDDKLAYKNNSLNFTVQ